METLLALIAVGVGVLLTAIAGLHVYMTATATPLHPDAGRVPSKALAAPAPTHAAAVEAARRALREGVAAQNLPGVSVAVGVDGELVWAEGFGFADLERRVVVAPDTRFRIGSASVVLTAAAAGRLIEQGRLTLDAEIQRYLPRYPRQPWPVTVRQLMSHTAGLRSDGGDEDPLYGMRCERPSEAFDVFADRELLFEPGTNYRYSSYGWIVVSAAMEAVADRSFAGLMRELVFEPLGMTDTRSDVEDERAARTATTYYPRYSADTKYGFHLMRPVSYSCYGGASGFLSTPSDLVRFGNGLRGDTLLRAETTRLMQTSLRLPSGEETGYGLGWDLETITLAGVATPVVGHDGTLFGGHVSSLMIVPAGGLVVAVVSNTPYADAPEIARQVAEAFVRPSGTASP